MPSNRGFSLLELILVMLVVALIAATASLSLGDRADTALRESADHLVQQMGLVRDETALSGRPWGLLLSASTQAAGYRWMKRVRSGWQPADSNDTGLQEGDWPTSVTSRLWVEGQEVLLNATADTPQIVFTSDGEVTPFELTLVGEQQQLTIRADALGRVEIENSTQP